MNDLLDLVRFLLFSSGWTRFPTDRYAVWSETLQQLQEWGQDRPGLEVLGGISFSPHALLPFAYGLEQAFGSLSVVDLISTLSPQYEVMQIDDPNHQLAKKDMSKAEQALLRKFKQVMPKVCRASKHEAMHELPA